MRERMPVTHGNKTFHFARICQFFFEFRRLGLRVLEDQQKRPPIFSYMASAILYAPRRD